MSQSLYAVAPGLPEQPVSPGDPPLSTPDPNAPSIDPPAPIEEPPDDEPGTGPASPTVPMSV